MSSNYTIHRAPRSYDEDQNESLTLILPGFLSSKDEQRYLDLANALNERGIDALRLNPPGIGGDEPKLDEHTQTRYLEAVSSLSAVTTSYKNIYSVGFSWGALTAMLHAKQEQQVAAVVSLMPTRTFIWGTAYDAEAAEKWREQGSRAFTYPDTSISGVSDVPYSVVEDSAQYDLLEDAGSLCTPTLIVGGEYDNVAPISWLSVLYSRMNCPKEMLVVKKSHHDYPSETVSSRVADWLLARQLDIPLLDIPTLQDSAESTRHSQSS